MTAEQRAVDALIQDWASASTERATITRWAAASRLRKAILADRAAAEDHGLRARVEALIKATGVLRAGSDGEVVGTVTVPDLYAALDQDSHRTSGEQPRKGTP